MRVSESYWTIVGSIFFWHDLDKANPWVIKNDIDNLIISTFLYVFSHDFFHDWIELMLGMRSRFGFLYQMHFMLNYGLTNHFDINYGPSNNLHFLSQNK